MNPFFYFLSDRVNCYVTLNFNCDQKRTTIENAEYVAMGDIKNYKREEKARSEGTGSEEDEEQSGEEDREAEG